jgi:pyruvate carboxylase
MFYYCRGFPEAVEKAVLRGASKRTVRAGKNMYCDEFDSDTTCGPH